MKRFLEVTVPYYIPIAVLGVVAGAVLATGAILDIRIFYAALSISLVVGGFNTLNGVFDAEIDEVNKPHRPIASGKMSKKTGFFYACFLYMAGVVISLTVNFYFISIVLLSVLLTASYSLPFIRLRRRFIVNTVTGLVFYSILCPLAGWSLYPATQAPVFLIVFLFLLGSGIAITKDFEDVYGDRMYRIRTLPGTIGIENANKSIRILIFLSFFYLVIISLMNIISLRYLAILIFSPWIFYTVYRLEPGNNNKMFFIKNLFLVISIELFIIVITLL